MKRAIILASLSVLCFLQFGWGQVPRTMSYQGVLKDAGGNLVNDSKAITFRLYDAVDAATGSAIWSEQLTVQIDDGVFSVILGETTALPDPFPAPAWLGIDVDATGEELSPRTRLTASPYSFNALRADTAQYALSSATGGAGWSLAGNSITTADFLGSTNNIALDFRVNGARALRLEPNAESPNVIGGYSGNSVTGGVLGATISGGGYSGYVNQVTANLGTVGGGFTNTASGIGATVGGGWSNNASGGYATVGGGNTNLVSGGWATIGGGNQNTADGTTATVGGGMYNTASGKHATVPGGRDNVAGGYYSFAAGYRAKANNDGAFVWADQTDADFASTAANQFLIRAAGGVGIGTTDPLGALDVNGTIYQRGIQIHADYVFEPDYVLESIEEHATFMWQNKHLKAIPEAKADENGREIIEVRAHRKGIVEELEKAHIYIEQLHEGMKEQQREIEALQAVVAALRPSN